MKRVTGIVLLAGSLACGDANSPQPTQPIGTDALLAHLEFLAGDSLYGRAAGSPHELIAAEYIRDQFIEYGLEQGSSDYLQTFIFLDDPVPLSTTHSGSQPQHGHVVPPSNAAEALTSQNVLGVLPGTGDLAGQWVILGAHYDHVGWERISEDSIVIHNGADDNASGVALMLEIARYLRHYLTAGAGGSLNHRSIMFQAYGAEEVGLLGSWHFTTNPSVAIDSVVAMINLDMVGRLRDDRLILGGVGTSDIWDLLLVELNDDRLNLDYNDGGLQRSDQYPFYVLDIPVLFFHTGLHADYHEPTDDTWLINLDGMVEVGNLALEVLFNAAIGETPPEFER